MLDRRPIVGKHRRDAAAQQTQQGYDCNAGKDSCTMGTKAKMTVVPVSEADKALLKKALTDTVLPKWAARCM